MKLMIVTSIESVSYFLLLQMLTNVLHLTQTIAAWMPHAATQMARTTVYVKEASSGTVSIVRVSAKTGLFGKIFSESNTIFVLLSLVALKKDDFSWPAKYNPMNYSTIEKSSNNGTPIAHTANAAGHMYRTATGQKTFHISVVKL